MSGGVHVLRPGLQTTVQDLGRVGRQDRGIAVAGAMDPFAHRLANALVGNARGAATLEITAAGPELGFDDERVVAVAGARFTLSVDGVNVPAGRSFVVPAGGRLTFGDRATGARAYLAVQGGFDVPRVMDSCATDVRNGFGGWHGRALKAGDRLPLGAKPAARAGRRQPRGGALHETNVVRVLPGPHQDRFAADALERLESGPYVVAADSDRMGYRLDGPPLTHRRGADMISEATVPGALQVPASGQPILLMAERQTTGGYPILAAAISADLGVAAQAMPGDALRFRRCSRAEAMAALLAIEGALLAVEQGPS
jgi:antagonist of KipI